MKLPRVICVGSATQDLFFPTDEGVILQTPEDVTSQVKIAFELGGKFRVADRFEALGGVAANVSVGLSRLDVPTACYSHIGDDTIGQNIVRAFEEEKVDISLLQKDSAVRSDVSAIVVATQTGDRIIFHNRDATEKLVLKKEQFKGTEWIHVSALNSNWHMNLNMIDEVAQAEGISIILNPGQHNLKDDPKRMLDFVRHTKALFLNKDEAIELLLNNEIETNTDKLNDELFLVQSLLSFGPLVVALTDGKRGAWAGSQSGVWHANSFEPNGLKDTTGGGDAFGSGFFAAYLRGLPIETCLSWGILNGGSVVGAYGAIAGLLTEAEIQALLPNVSVEKLV